MLKQKIYSSPTQHKNNAYLIFVNSFKKKNKYQFLLINSPPSIKTLPPLKTFPVPQHILWPVVSHNSKFVREEASPLAVRPGEMGTEGERQKKKKKEKIKRKKF